jgi:hypothetical protein
MLNFEHLPDEVILQTLSYSETKDLIAYGQASKRIRKITRDSTLWVTANLAKKIVKTELLEMILSKGCKILNIFDCTIVGSLSSNMKSQLKALELSQSVSKIDVLEKILLSCCSLQHLKMEGLHLTTKMADSICKNGKTLQVLNLNHSHVIGNHYSPGKFDHTVPRGNFQAIIKSCQELKELAFINSNAKCLPVDDLEFFARNLSPNVVKVNLFNQNINDGLLKVLLSRCNKVKVLILEATLITEDSLKTIRQYLNPTLEELRLSYYWPVTSVLELKSMPRLQILDLVTTKRDEKKIQNLRKHLPHLMIRSFSCY